MREVSRAYARENQLSSADGVLVIGVQRGYSGAVAGLAGGDVITKIKDAPVDSLAVVQEAEAVYAADPQRVLIEARRKFRVSLYVLKP